jgi:hypothetical protein
MHKMAQRLYDRLEAECDKHVRIKLDSLANQVRPSRPGTHARLLPSQALARWFLSQKKGLKLSPINLPSLFPPAASLSPDGSCTAGDGARAAPGCGGRGVARPLRPHDEDTLIIGPQSVADKPSHPSPCRALSTDGEGPLL